MQWFRKFAATMSQMVGSPWAFIAASGLIVGWMAASAALGFSEVSLLLVNTGSTILTFLIVFLIQNTQNRHYQAIHLKLNELIRGVEGARTRLVDLEALTDDELKRLEQEFQKLRERESAKEEHPLAPVPKGFSSAPMR